jgi:hypothetical protein
VGPPLDTVGVGLSVATAEPTETKAKASDRAIYDRMEKFFLSSLDHPMRKSWEQNAIKCFKYKQGEQWTVAEKAVLAERGQPDTVNNQVRVTIDRLVGQFVKQRTRIGYRGRNPQDDPSAQALTDVFLFIKQNNQMEYEEREMAEDGFTCGFGVLEAYVEFNDLYEPEIMVRADDVLNYFPDPESRRYNWNEDARFVCRQKWMDVEEVAERYPEKAGMVRAVAGGPADGFLGRTDSVQGKIYLDPNRQRVRMIDCWYRTQEMEKWLFYQGQLISADDMGKREAGRLRKDGAQVADRLKSTLHMGVFSAGILFEHKETDRTHYPFIPYYANRMKTGEPYSLILTALPLQDSINKRASKAVHLLNTNQAIFQTNSVADKAELAAEKARPDGMIEVRNIEQFQLNSNIELAVTQYNMYNDDKVAFRQVVGVNPEALGEKSEVRSGVGIARKQAMTDLIVLPLFDNFRRTRVILANVILELIQKYYTQKKVFSITDDLGKTRVIAINDEDENGDPLNAIKQGIYDVIVDEMPDVTTVQEEQMQIITQSLPQILSFGPVWAKLLFQMSDLRNKDELIEQIEAMTQPPPPDPKFSVSLQWSELGGPEKAAFAQKLGMPELTQFEAQSGSQPAHLVKVQADMQREQQKVQGEQGKMQMEMEKDNQEMTHQREKHQLDMQKTMVGVQAAAAKAEMAMVAGKEKNGSKK